MTRIFEENIVSDCKKTLHMVYLYNLYLLDFLIDIPSHYVDADAPIQGIVIESDDFCYSVVPSLEVCASSLAKALLVRDPAVYSPWYVMPEQMLMDPVNQRIRPESMWAQDVVATWDGSDDKEAKVVRDWRFAREKLAKLMPVCLNFKGEWVLVDGYSVDYFNVAW